MAFLEKNAQQKFKEVNLLYGAFELKLVNLTKSKSFAYDHVADHQIEALQAISTGKGLYHKIADSPVSWQTKMRFGKPKPFDCFKLKDIPAYVVICWYNPEKARGNKEFHYIRIQAFLDKRAADPKKSMRIEASREIAEGILNI